jgi:cold-inducible RNA-binding protein
MEDKKKLYVGNIPYTLDVDALRKAFEEFGEIVDAVIITDKHSGRSKGFGFVEFAKEEDAQKAIDAMNGKEFEGRALVVNVARPPRER